MKNFLLSFLLLSVFMSCKPSAQESSTEINWVSLEQAQAMAEKEPRKIFIDVYTPWCGPCKKMTSQTFTNPELVQYINKNFYAVKFNAESDQPVTFNGKTYANPNYKPAKGKMTRNSRHQLAEFLNIKAYPTLLLLNDNMEVVESLKGYKTAENLISEFQKIEKQLAQK